VEDASHFTGRGKRNRKAENANQEIDNAIIKSVNKNMDAQHGQALENIVSQLRIGLNPDAIYLFGSHARGDATTDSDLDLLVVVEKSDQPRHRRAQEARRLAGEKSVSKDILVLTRSEWTKGRRVACSLPTTVSREGRLLYER